MTDTEKPPASDPTRIHPGFGDLGGLFKFLIVMGWIGVVGIVLQVAFLALLFAGIAGIGSSEPATITEPDPATITEPDPATITEPAEEPAVTEPSAAEDAQEAPDAAAEEAPAIAVEAIRTYDHDEIMELVETDEFHYYETPREGFSFWGVLVEVTNHDDEPLDPYDLVWTASGPENVVYHETFIVAESLSPVLADVAAINPGGTQQGHVFFAMRNADAAAVGARSLHVETFDGRTINVPE